MQAERQILLIDADDTLWENNIYFERAIERFYQLLAPSPHSTAAMRERINLEERRIIAEAGYGLVTFEIALQRAYAALAPGHGDRRDVDEAARAIRPLAQQIANEPIELLPEVEATLQYLARRHRLVLMTKGDFAEQTRKLELSGLRPLFDRVFVVAEKHVAAYRATLAELEADPARAWMIGNSPKSDINPALRAGMNAVFIPHPFTWVLEEAEIEPAPGKRCTHLERFGHLRLHF